ncbi:MAG TPA: sugar ABC transporter ATP-binding protein, partial [Clostridiaceae bacterium]|nr:sugar ABC transporter ATP-binding protein [Clostridiaceae bacterium]
MSKYLIEMRNVSKTFPGVRALDSVDFRVKKGEVRALVGKNGAGKSTLIKLLTGLNQPSSGDIYIDGTKISNITPHKMYNLGIEAVYQENDLIPFFTVAESIMLNHEPVLDGVFLDERKMHEQAHAILSSKLGINIDTHKLIKELNVSEKQFVQISRSLVKNPKVMIFDEPTAPLLEEEIRKLFDIIEKLKRENVTIIYISHRLDEIFRIADTVTVLKDGRKEIDLTLKDSTEEELIRYMTGEKDSITLKAAETGTEEKDNLGEVVLSVNRLSTQKARNISFELRKHEILGFFGAEGAGQEELTKALFGLIPVSYESIRLNGKD